MKRRPEDFREVPVPLNPGQTKNTNSRLICPVVLVKDFVLPLTLPNNFNKTGFEYNSKLSFCLTWWEFHLIHTFLVFGGVPILQKILLWGEVVRERKKKKGFNAAYLFMLHICSLNAQGVWSRGALAPVWLTNVSSLAWKLGVGLSMFQWELVSNI